MNNGLLSGITPSVSSYGFGPSPAGSWSGNRGRYSNDEYRAWGYPDGRRREAVLGSTFVVSPGATRLVNTNPQAGVGSIYYPSDLGSVNNVLSGSIACYSYPFSAAYNTAGVVHHLSAGSNYSAFESNTEIKNFPGAAINPGFMSTLVAGNLYLADGAACTLNVNPAVEVLSQVGFTTINSGTLTVPAYYNFQAKLPRLDSGVTVTSRSAYRVEDSATGGTLTTQIGLDIPTLIAAGTTNTGIALQNSNATATVQPQAMTIGAGSTITLNFASAAAGSAVTYTPTLALQQSGSTLGMAIPFNVQPTVKNVVGQSASPGLYIGFNEAATIEADTQTGLTQTTYQSYKSNPTITRINSGTLTVTGLTQYESVLTVATGATVTTRTGFHFADATVTGTLTGQYGIDIAALAAAGTTNVGIRNASVTVYTPTANQTLAAATVVNPNATCVKVIQTSGANITLTGAPTVSAGIDGEILHIINVSTVAGSTFTFQSVSSLAGSTLSLGATTRIVGIKGSLTLIYNATLSRWVEVGFNAGAFG